MKRSFLVIMMLISIIPIACKKSSTTPLITGPVTVVFPDTIQTPIHYRVFVTNQTYDGNFGTTTGYSAEAACAFCQQQAREADLGGVWKAWIISTYDITYTEINAVPGPWYTVDGVKISNNLQGDLLNPINADQFGNSVPYNALAWVGSSSAGHCNNWTSNVSSATIRGVVGNTSRIDSGWNSWGSAADCSSQYHLYCFEVSKE